MDSRRPERLFCGRQGSEILRATLRGEQEAARFAQAGGRGIVLRFAGFYGPDVPSAIEMVQMAQQRKLAQFGPGTNFFSSIFVPDAARAVVEALSASSGIYNVCDDNPVTFADYLRILSNSAKAPRPFRLPGFLGKLVFGDVWSCFSRSQRVSNARLKEATNWKPSVKSVSEGWPLIAAGLDERKREPEAAPR